MDKTIDLLEVARKDITLGDSLDDVEQAAWDALDVDERMTLQQKARKLCRDAWVRQARADIATHGEKARKHYSTMSSTAQDALGLRALLRVTAPAQPQARGLAAPRERRDRRTSSPTRAGPGDDGESAEPPSTGRLCGCGCREDISHLAPQAHYLNDTHGKRARRARDGVKRLAVADSVEHLSAENLPRGCRCGGELLDRDPEGDWICVPCGRPLKVPGTTPNGYDARMSKARDLMRNDKAEGRQVHRARRPREWRTRPTRKTRKVAA
jgi:hypothetical protein